MGQWNLPSSGLTVAFGFRSSAEVANSHRPAHNSLVSPSSPSRRQTVEASTDIQRRRYADPPIEEAVCEVEFVMDAPLDITQLGRLASDLHDQYPGPPRQRQMVQAGVNIGLPGSLQQTLSVNPGSMRIELLDSDPPQHIVSLGGVSVSIHALRPYKGWVEDYRQRVSDALSSYINLTSGASVTRIGLRYINRLVIEDEQFDLTAYFQRIPDYPAGEGSTLNGFLSRSEGTFDETDIRWATTFASTPPIGNGHAFILDIDLNDQAPMSDVDSDAILDRIEELRNRERSIFETWITDKLRATFDGS